MGFGEIGSAQERMREEVERLKTDFPSSIAQVAASPPAQDNPSAEGLLVSITVYPSDDLLIGRPVGILIACDQGWPAAPPRVTIPNTQQLKCEFKGITHDGVVSCEFLSRDAWSRLYTLTMVLHVVRSLLRSPDAPATPWEHFDNSIRPRPEIGASSGRSFGLRADHSGVQGRRRTMEDAAVIQQGLHVPGRLVNSAAVFAIFDGHAGDACARFAEQEFVPELMRSLAGEQAGQQPGRLVDWREALHHTFLQVDKRYLQAGRLADRQAGMHAGCTACVVAFDGTDRLVAANLGDCRAVLCRGRKAVDVTFDCRADRPDEVARIVENGGFVTNKRVNAQLAVSRALGDGVFKSPLALVTACPEITEIYLQPADEFLVMACDGLWDVMTSQEVVDFVRERLQGPDTLRQVASELVNYAVNVKRSSDNVSATIALVTTPDQDGGLVDPARHRQAMHKTTQEPGGCAPRGSSVKAYEVLDKPAGLPSRNAGESASSLFGGFQDAPGKPEPSRVEKKPEPDSIEDDDELMEFLMDDSNFT